MIDAVPQLIGQNSQVNQADVAGLPKRIADAIKSAAVRTGVDFSYLLKKAAQESGFDPHAKASTSSATGLFQFTNQTWLRMIKDHGAEYGLSAYADHIQIDKAGVARVEDPRWRATILGMRNDPQISANMAGELDKQNLGALKDNVGGKIGSTELYLAHFLGAGGASDFLNKMRQNPHAKAADVLPEAASANTSVFYSADGKAKSLSQIYQRFAQKFEGTGTAVTSAVSHARSYVPSVPHYTFASTVSDETVSDAALAPVVNSLKTSGSSLFATMVLAQMNFGEPDSLLSLGTADSREKSRENGAALYSSIS